MNTQLTFLNEFFPTQIEPTENYWKRHFNWQPEVGKLARIDTPIAYCINPLNTTSYCYCMEVKVLKISDGKAVCETTEEWAAACRAFGTGSGNSAGSIWLVDLNDLAPKFRNENDLINDTRKFI